MPYDLKTLHKHGVSSAAYKKKFTVPPEKYEPGIRKLVDLISNRIKDGTTLSLKEWRAYHAIDLAYETPFNQTTPTLVHHIASQHLTAAQTMDALKDWGLAKEELFIPVPTEDPTVTQWMLNFPLFFQVGIPLVKAYSTMRLANLFNQRNTNPLLLYQPLTMSDHDQVLCEIVTDMVNKVSTWYGYPAVLRQILQQVVKYGTALAFPREEWDCQKQLVTGEDGEEKEVITKEGIRYFIPHPTRMGFDLKYPLTSLNTDTGTEFAFAWNIAGYGEILDNRLYWNRRKIFCGTNWFQAPWIGNYFQEVFPCRMKFPNRTGTWDTFTREDKAGWYNSGDRDQAVFKVEYFQKLIPKQFGLAEYDHPVWHRFTVAGDDTIIWAAPCAYTPAWFMGWDYDENASRNSSMALECIPWQDTLGNILSQMILTAKQNLMNVVFYDNQQIDKEDIRRLENKGERKYREMVFIGFDSLAKRMAQQSPQGAFFPVKFDKQGIQELLQLIPTVLNIMERVLGITAQEAGSAASHQQSKEEVERTGEAGQNRVALTFSYVDEGLDAWKRQQFDANMAYRNSEITAQVSTDIPDLDHVLKDLGFTITQRGEDKIVVNGKKSKLLRLESFARTGEGALVNSNKEAGQILLQVVQVVSAQEDLKQKIGAKNLLALVEFSAKLLGAPRDFRLRVLSPEKEGQDQAPPPNIVEAIKAAQQATMQTVEEQVAKPAAQEVAKVQGEVQQLQQAIQQLQKIYDIAAKQQDKDAQESQRAAAEQQRKDMVLQKEEERKSAALAAEQQRKEAEFQADQARKEAESQAEIARKDAEAQAEIERKRREAAAKPDTAKKAPTK